jgi:hypothetical protein
MARLVAASFAVLLLASAAGCSMCQSCYDYCGPVYEGCGEACNPGYRAGSILSPGGHPGQIVSMESGEPSMMGEQMVEPTPAPTPAKRAGKATGRWTSQPPRDIRVR